MENVAIPFISGAVILAAIYFYRDLKAAKAPSTQAQVELNDTTLPIDYCEEETLHQAALTAQGINHILEQIGHHWPGH